MSTDPTPVLDGYVTADGVNVAVWCAHCAKWHLHGHCTGSATCTPGVKCVCPLGSGDGHRRPHCHDRRSPYDDTGYVIREMGHITFNSKTGRALTLTSAAKTAEKLGMRERARPPTFPRPLAGHLAASPADEPAEK